MKSERVLCSLFFLSLSLLGILLNIYIALYCEKLSSAIKEINRIFVAATISIMGHRSVSLSSRFFSFFFLASANSFFRAAVRIKPNAHQPAFFTGLFFVVVNLSSVSLPLSCRDLSEMRDFSLHCPTKEGVKYCPFRMSRKLAI